MQQSEAAFFEELTDDLKQALSTRTRKWGDINAHITTEHGKGVTHYCEGECTGHMKNILQEADELTSGDRQKEYGHPKVNFQHVADLWSVVLGVKVSSHMVVICLILLKTCRAMQGYKRDTYVDIAGYARCAEMLEGEPIAAAPVPEKINWLCPKCKVHSRLGSMCFGCGRVEQ